MGKVLNFDDYLKERRKERGFEIVLFDSTYTLPPSLPYQIVLFFKSLSQRKSEDTIDDEMIIGMFELLFGKANVDKMKTKMDFDVDLMLEILRQVLDLYGITKKTTEETDPKPTAAE